MERLPGLFHAAPPALAAAPAPAAAPVKADAGAGAGCVLQDEAQRIWEAASPDLSGEDAWIPPPRMGSEHAVWKVLSRSDIYGQGGLAVPKRAAEMCLPPLVWAHSQLLCLQAERAGLFPLPGTYSGTRAPSRANALNTICSSHAQGRAGAREFQRGQLHCKEMKSVAWG